MKGAPVRPILIVLALALLVSGPVASQSLLVSAAASLTDILKTLDPAAQKAVGMSIQYNFGGSGTLRAQIEQGAPLDVFMSASSLDMDRLAGAGLILQGSRFDYLENLLVVVGDASASPFKSPAEVQRALVSAPLLAIGNPDSVPAGRYAKEAITALGLEGALGGKMLLGGSVRDVLAFVQSGSAPLGFVYLTDTMSPQGKGTKELYRFPPSSFQNPIRYPVAIVADASQKAAARAFLSFLKSEEARSAFSKAGFIVL